MGVSTHDRLERLTQPFRPESSPGRRLGSAPRGVPFAEIVSGPIAEASLGDTMHKLILVSAGQLDVEGATGGWLIVAGHLIFVPAERAFRLNAAPGTTLHVAHLDPADATWIHHGCWSAAATPLAREMLGRATHWSAAEVEAGGTARLFFRTLSGLCSEWFTNRRLLWLPAAQSDPIRRAVLHLRDHLADAGLDGIAAAAGLSPRTLQRHCRAELGLSWRDLVREVRMMRSLELLTVRHAAVNAVARQIGFASNAAFTTAFTKRFGLNPSHYAARCRAASWS